MKTKKTYTTALFSLLTGAAIFGLTACGGNDDATVPADPPAETEPAVVAPDTEPAPGEVEPETPTFEPTPPATAPDDEGY